MHYTYILKSLSHNILYTGSTTNLKRRLHQHNTQQSKSTSPYSPWKLIFYSAFETEELAVNYEKYLKSGSGKAMVYKRLIRR